MANFISTVTGEAKLSFIQAPTRPLKFNLKFQTFPKLLNRERIRECGLTKDAVGEALKRRKP